MPNVYIPSLPTRYDAATGQRVPSLDLNPAAAYGDLVNMVDGPVEDIPAAISIIKEKVPRIMDFDYVLAVGDVILTTALIAYVCAQNGSAHVLRWDRKRHEYDIVEVVL